MPTILIRFTRFFFLPLVASLLFSIPLPANAWNAMGHMVVASIAYKQLKPHAKAAVDEMVRVFHQEYPEMNSFEQTAYWLDAVRGQKIDMYSRWHYIDNSFSSDGTPTHNTIDADNAVWAVKSIEAVVKNKNANPYERARFLAFLVHIVGDLHQPMHTVTLFSAQHPNGDRGGNDYHVIVNGNRTNLHALWDSGVAQYNETDSVETAQSLSTSIIEAYPAGYFSALPDDTNPDDWVKEGIDRAKNLAYNTQEGQVVSASYLAQGQQSAEEATALAGYRLARLLNQLLE